jgi:hypothetical protein
MSRGSDGLVPGILLSLSIALSPYQKASDNYKHSARDQEVKNQVLVVKGLVEVKTTVGMIVQQRVHQRRGTLYSTKTGN